MAPSEEALRSAATRLRVVARFIPADLDALPADGGPTTWLGPAAMQFRTKAAAAVSSARKAAVDLVDLADRLDGEADLARLEAQRTEEGPR